MGGSCTQVGEPGTWNPADPKVSRAQPPWHEAADAKKAPAIVWGAAAPSLSGSPNPVAEFAATGTEFIPRGLLVQGYWGQEMAMGNVGNGLREEAGWQQYVGWPTGTKGTGTPKVSHVLLPW